MVVETITTTRVIIIIIRKIHVWSLVVVIGNKVGGIIARAADTVPNHQDYHQAMIVTTTTIKIEIVLNHRIKEKGGIVIAAKATAKLEIGPSHHMKEKVVTVTTTRRVIIVKTIVAAKVRRDGVNHQIIKMVVARLSFESLKIDV